MKTKNLIGIILGIISLQLGAWGFISGRSELVILGVVNLSVVFLFFSNELIKILTGGVYTKDSLIEPLKELLEKYGITLLTMLLVWFLLSWFIRGVGSVSLIIIVVLWGIVCSITNRSLLKKGLYRGTYTITIKNLLLIASLIVTTLLFSYNRIAAPEILYPLSIFTGFVVYSLGLELYRSMNISFKRWRTPLRLLYAGILCVVVTWSLGTYALQRIDEHTIEKIVVEEKVIYVPIESEITTEIIDCYAPTNALCDNSEQGRTCKDGRTQDGLICAEIVEIEIIEDEGEEIVIVPEQSLSLSQSRSIIQSVKAIEVESVVEENNSQLLSPGSYIKLRNVLGNGNTAETEEVISESVESTVSSPIEQSIKNNNPQSVNDLIKGIAN